MPIYYSVSDSKHAADEANGGWNGNPENDAKVLRKKKKIIKKIRERAKTKQFTLAWASLLEPAFGARSPDMLTEVRKSKYSLIFPC